MNRLLAESHKELKEDDSYGPAAARRQTILTFLSGENVNADIKHIMGFATLNNQTLIDTSHKNAVASKKLIL